MDYENPLTARKLLKVVYEPIFGICEITKIPRLNNVLCELWIYFEQNDTL